MTREEKCKLAIERGYTYDSNTGFVYSRLNKLVKTINKEGYNMIALRYNYKTKNLCAHQFAWYYMYKEIVEEIDHINGIRNDNRICNLRSVTRQQNHWNRINTKGYTYNKTANKFQAQIKVNKKHITLGYFNTEFEARNAYLQAKEKYHII
jgi:hypothetical protein